MASDRTERRLAAIMFTDIVGYTALMAESEERGLRVRKRHRQVLKPLVEQYHGEWVQDVGDEDEWKDLVAVLQRHGEPRTDALLGALPFSEAPAQLLKPRGDTTCELSKLQVGPPPLLGETELQIHSEQG